MTYAISKFHRCTCRCSLFSCHDDFSYSYWSYKHWQFPPLIGLPIALFLIALNISTYFCVPDNTLSHLSTHVRLKQIISYWPSCLISVFKVFYLSSFKCYHSCSASRWGSHVQRANVRNADGCTLSIRESLGLLDHHSVVTNRQWNGCVKVRQIRNFFLQSNYFSPFLLSVSVTYLSVEYEIFF